MTGNDNVIICVITNIVLLFELFELILLIL